MNQENKPETVEQAAYEYSLLTAGQSDAEDDFIAGANWQASQHSYTEQKWVSVSNRVKELEDMQVQASNDYEFCARLQYAIHELKKVLKQADPTPPTYTQEQMIAFGERLKQGVIDLPTLNDYEGLTPFRFIDTNDIENIDISKLLNK